MVEKVGEADLAYIQKNCTALIYIQTENQSQHVLQRAAQGIRRIIRCNDSIILLEAMHSCAILLPMTPLEGAQAVAQRISALLVHLQVDVQIVYAEAAQALIQRIRDDWEVAQAVMIEASQLETAEKNNTPGINSNTCLGYQSEPWPYLAFLNRYPTKRLLQLFPYELACRYRCVPIGTERGILTLATQQRLEADIVGLLRKAVRRNIFQVHCEISIIEDILQYWQRTCMR
ncbi:hypothetical protein [Dictyobacter formicarum]|uniref:Type II secretion system protein GspE N-terminal domain-containing protein n=1 Tax=Dictyobacter formicarum TaxID=2778368 RepID=A0ABQ3VSC5_9CHLR|nr:hypothetical protein [Dictyobacter formicarum]GHO88723.1 hypothetical protein KSZ_67290 [Dictyobacter formicarum]